MALVTVQRSPSVSSSPQSSDSGAGAPADEDDAAKSCKSLSECYFAGKGAALVLPPNERARPSRRVSAAGCDIQQHLQSMFYLLRPEETLKMAVKLESVHPGRTRYLVVVSCTGRQDAEESCLLGIDCHARATVGLVLRVLADTAITLDGDGGFSVSVCGRQHIFKPVSVQAMWSALQTLHKVSSKAREQNYFQGGLSHDWVSYYDRRIESDRSCLNEWHAMDSLESRRPPSPDSVRTKPRKRDETERVIRSKLKEIMMSVDLDEVTSKYIRGRLEEDLDMDLGEFKPFIDQEMLTILGQMDAPTEIFDHVYLGSEWNASNLEELQKNGVRHILNVTREIDNFFPGMFTYLNVRVYDDEKTDLLKHWDDTFKYITKAKKEGSKVLVHCKMGVSRSASVVIAYAMKAYNWDFSQAWKHVKDKRNCIKPNNSFLLQLETYQGILDAMKNKEKLQRSKSDTNLKSPTSVRDHSKKEGKPDTVQTDLQEISGLKLRKTGQRPKSWSPSVELGDDMVPSAPLSQSLESIDKAGNADFPKENFLRTTQQKRTTVDQETRNVLMPCDNGQSYSVSQNKILHLPGPDATSSGKCKLESGQKSDMQGQRRKGLVLNLTNQFEAVNSKPSSPGSDVDGKPLLQSPMSQSVETTSSKQSSEMAPMTSTATTTTTSTQQLKSSVVNDGLQRQAQCPLDTSGNIVQKLEDWYPSAQQNGKRRTVTECRIDEEDSRCTTWMPPTEEAISRVEPPCNNVNNTINGSANSESVPLMCATTTTVTAPMATGLVYTSSTQMRKPRKDGDPFSAQLDRVFDREERRGEPASRESPSRQSSWSSYDSAVVLDHSNSVHSSWATLPSRNSSWGSYDMRPSDLLGSSGLFPYDKEEIPWYPGTVKRTKQKLEEGSVTGGVKRVCTQACEEEDKLDQTSSTESEEIPLEGYNPAYLQRASSPTQRRKDDVPTLPEQNSKIQTSRNSSSPAKVIDISPVSVNVGRLSTSAPAPSSLSSDSELPASLRSCKSESETSSPCVVNTTQCSSVKYHKMVLENLNNAVTTTLNKRCLPTDDSPESECPRSISGIVKNLKKEFEAKSTKVERSPENFCDNEGSVLVTRPKRDAKIRSLPSSPVIPHNESKIQVKSIVFGEGKGSEARRENLTTRSKDATEDLSVRVLVGKYEVVKAEAKKAPEVPLRIHKDKDWDAMEVHPPAKSKIAPDFARRSAPIIISNHSSAIYGEGTPETPGRPPVPAPSVVVASVVAKAASKKQQQHGRTHPLARLQVRPRHSSPVYNTM